MRAIKITLMRSNAKVPSYPSAGSSCFELSACFYSPEQSMMVGPGSSTLVGTGLAFAIPAGWALEVFPCSPAQSALDVVGAPIQVESNDRSEVYVTLLNKGSEFLEVKDGEVIALAKMVEAPRWAIQVVPDLPDVVDSFNGPGTQHTGGSIE